MKPVIQGAGVALLCVILTSAASGTSARAARLNFPPASGVAALSSNDTELHPTDPHKELRYLSKNLKLKRDQRVGVGSILQERAREIQLLLDVESLSQQRRDVLAAKVMQDSNAQIETLLRNNQKRKFDKEFAKDREAL